VAPVPGPGPDAAGLVPVQPTGEIATWPPLPTPDADARPINPVTGQLRRPRALVVTAVGCWLAGAGWAGAFALFWWQAATVSGFHRSARILTWTEPEPASFWAIFWVMLIALLTVMVIGLAVAVGYNAWRGQSWTSWGGLIGLVLVAGLSWLLQPWAIFAVIPYAVAAGTLWLPWVRRHLAAASLDQSGPATVPIDPSPVLYGSRRPIGG
jgi:hypothetical protein